MAVPDPHINELTLMSYEPRLRACKDLYKVPRKGDYIEVLWLIDNLPDLPTRWCPAEVLHVYGSPDQGFLAKGAIRYLPGESWEMQFDFVDFMEGFKLRCAATQGEEDDDNSPGTERMENNNPCIEWRFADEQVGKTDQSVSDSDDGNWSTGNAEDATSKRKRTLNSVPRDEESRKRAAGEIKTLRNGHASLVVEVEKLKRELVTLSNHLATVVKPDERNGKCITARCVLPRLRQKLALKMQGGLRHTPKPLKRKSNCEPDQDLSISYVDGCLPGLIRARVECSLQQFESVSRVVRARSCSGAVCFSPEFSYSQLPLQCSVEFRILFKTFTHLCDIIGIASTSDKKEMARKCGNSPKGDVLRFLGTYCYDEKDERTSAHFFPGSSCGESRPQAFESPTPDRDDTRGTTDEADPLFPILCRKTREWNKVDGRYHHKLRKRMVSLPVLTENCPDTKAFTMVWKRAAELGGRAWSQALCDSGDVFGWLEVSLPFVQTAGKQLCQELGGVGNDDMWNELLSTHNGKRT